MRERRNIVVLVTLFAGRLLNKVNFINEQENNHSNISKFSGGNTDQNMQRFSVNLICLKRLLLRKYTLFKLYDPAVKQIYQYCSSSFVLGRKFKCF